MVALVFLAPSDCHMNENRVSNVGSRVCRRFDSMLLNKTKLLPVMGIAELWFESQEAFTAAYATEIGQAVAADSMAHLASRVRMFTEEVSVFG